MDGLGYLIMDKATPHWTEDILNKYQTYKSFISFIPAGLTRYFQPLDVSVNKPFKTVLKEKNILTFALKKVMIIKQYQDIKLLNLYAAFGMIIIS